MTSAERSEARPTPGAVSPGEQHHPAGWERLFDVISRGYEGPADEQPCSRDRPSANTTLAPPIVVDGGRAVLSPIVRAGMALLQCRVDALYVAFQGQVDPRALALFRRETSRARRLRTDVRVELAPGVAVTMAPTSLEGRWNLAHEELRATIEPDADGGWAIEVRPSAVLLGRVGALAAYDCAEGLAACVLLAITGRRLRRIDLCADWLGFGLQDVDVRAFMRPSYRTDLKPHTELVEHLGGLLLMRTGLTMGKSDVRFDFYDKTHELKKPENAGAKRDEEHARYHAAGWNGVDPVERTEFTARGDALKQLTDVDGNPLRDDPRRVLRSELDRLWCYFTDRKETKRGEEPGWTRLILLGTATRRERCAVDPRWLAVRAVRFRGDIVALPVRVRKHAPAQAERMVGNALTLAAQGFAGLGGVEHVPSRADLAKMTRAEREGWLDSVMTGHRMSSVYKVGVREVLAEWKQRRGVDEAAEYVAERMRAAATRVEALHKVLGERRAIEAEGVLAA